MPVETRVDAAPDAMRRYFAAELRRLRTERGLTQEQAARLMTFSASLVAEVEKLRRVPTEPFAVRCDEVFATDGFFTRMVQAMPRGYPKWFQPFVKLEAEALALHSFEVQVVPGLLQTEDYARAVLNTWPPKKPEEIEKQVRARLQRQELLVRHDMPRLWFVLDESVLRRPMGDDDVMSEQLRRLIEHAELPNLSLQVLPYAQAKKAPTSGSFVVLTSPDRSRFLYMEGPGDGRVTPDQAIVESYTEALDAARAQALPVEDSIAFIAGLRSELYGHR
ncbi:helix-turn-helix domain-containing protein [Actinocatenispora rupis]|uniref:Transcriptional regulator n=1 Tax=Actinocatenispora rupis TaxID=519421 RepID=A0A8J3NA14_9ACTN|nr:helix-turn-helix transcriptional regulator [Actinocatenispora rupis]GID11631.1 transcriptional regulator [Actinocatenispora rupis]